MFTVTGKIICEYIWIGGNNELRSKTRVVERVEGVQEWNYDASSTRQASSDGNTEGILKPVAYFMDPLRKIKDCECILVLCETYDVNGVPLQTNHRNSAEKIFREHLEEEPWFGLEQEYFMVQNNRGEIFIQLATYFSKLISVFCCCQNAKVNLISQLY